MSTLTLILRNFFFSSLDVDKSQGNELGEYESESVKKTLDDSYVPSSILNARKVQDKMIRDRFEGKDLSIADIGCGDGYHGEIFGPASKLYHGFEISSDMAEQSRNRWKGIKNSKVFEGDASTMKLKPNTYDIVWSLYFTPGNFRQEFSDLSLYDDAYLDANPAFIGIIDCFYKALKKDGKIFLCVYKDIPKTEAMQREFYTTTGQTVITPLGSRFVATKEHFWSVRWTERSMLSNLKKCGIKPTQVKFNDLNDVAWLVEVTK